MSPLTPHPIALQLGGLGITSHGLFFALGAEVGYLILARLASRRGLPTDRLAEQVLAIFFAGLVAARIGFFVIYPSEFRSVAQVLSIWEGGLVSFFGIAGGLAVAALLFKGRRAEWLGLLGVAVLSAWGVGRVGNFLAGDSVGVMSASWAFFYGRVPIQLFESVLCLAMGAFWYRRLATRNLLAWTLLSYLLVRFFVDFWRDEGSWGPLHIGQWVSLALLLPVAAYLGRRGR